MKSDTLNYEPPHLKTRVQCIEETREARREVGRRPMKCQGWKVGENRSKLCSLGGRVSTLALILECEMYFIFFWLE